MIEVTPAGDNQNCIEARGELDACGSARLREEIVRFFESGRGDLHLRLQGIEFIDPMGVAVLLEAAEMARASCQSVTLVQPSQQVAGALSAAGYGTLFDYDYCESEEAPPPSGPLVDEALVTETFEAEGRAENMARLRRGVERFARHMPFTSQEMDDIKLAVGEATANALRYGCRTGREHIRITCTRCGRRFGVEISDTGEGFDPERLPVVDAGHMAEGGRGVHFMRCLMDEVHFRFGNGTTVEMVKFTREQPDGEDTA